AMSSISFKGEFAYMSPDPNTKKSTISSDQGKSIAYIDDFEGSKRIIPIGVSYTAWKDLSPPDNMGILSNLSKKLLMNYKAKSFWFNVLPSNVKVTDIWPNKSVSRNDEQVTVLDYVYRPSSRGSYNYNPTLENPSRNWGGMMKLLSSSASDLTKENIEYLEFWLQVKEAPENAKIYIDLGRISEDIIPNDKRDTEDKNDNGLLDEGEDTGIDGLLDYAEPNYSSTTPDPSGDNFQFVFSSNANPNANDYQNINGTEGNGQLSDNGRLPDAEDLNNNRNLDVVNSYFRYAIPLDTNRITNPFIAGGGDNARWYLYKVPLKDFAEKVNDPSFSLVEIIRVWVSGVESDVHLRIAEFNLVGNQWQKVLRPPFVTADDDVLTLSTINIEDNPDYYSPPGVFRERDKSKTEEEVLANEQSLLLKIKNLKDGDKRDIVKYLTRPLDVFFYKEMKLFVHGDLNDQNGSVSNYISENDYASEVYFRFGADSLNYYEYRQPVRSGWNEIKILFSDLTALKQRRSSDTATVRIPVPGVEGHYYGVKGKPTLRSLQYFTIGVINPKELGTTEQEVSGDIWVNELRVLEADDSPGWAYSGATSIRFADILNVNVNMSQTDPNFHRLAERFGSREERRAWGVMADLDVIKVLPVSLPGSTFKLNYQHTESMVNPVYLPTTDIKISEAAEQLEQKRIDEGYTQDEAKAEAERLKFEAQTLNVSDTWSLS
ncbi:MAG TPA: cell surface protein SprA, partial [Melioribacteraceae bacterium]|nr:cell surface protein SprA [Melioribacteraceae bacterium]